jgi:hypothetical protein
MTVALTTIAAVSLAILVYIAVVITGTYTTQNMSPSINASFYMTQHHMQAKDI